jgi:hypothetical protein
MASEPCPLTAKVTALPAWSFEATLSMWSNFTETRLLVHSQNLLELIVPTQNTGPLMLLAFRAYHMVIFISRSGTFYVRYRFLVL